MTKMEYLWDVAKSYSRVAFAYVAMSAGIALFVGGCDHAIREYCKRTPEIKLMIPHSKSNEKIQEQKEKIVKQNSLEGKTLGEEIKIDAK